MIALSLLNENHKTNNLSLLGTILASARSMPTKTLLEETRNFFDPKTKARVLAIEPAHPYKIFLK